MSLGKGLFFIFWILIITMVRIGILWIIPGSNPNYFVNEICASGNMLPYDNITYSIFILSFTSFYFIMPMLISNNINYTIIIFFISYLIFDFLIKYSNGCIKNITGIFGDLVGGGGLGALIVSILYNSPIQNYLFINEVSSNNETCAMASKQTFKCSVYKNGQLVSSTNT